jgi:hypothetical protein
MEKILVGTETSAPADLAVQAAVELARPLGPFAQTTFLAPLYSPESLPRSGSRGSIRPG